MSKLFDQLVAVRGLDKTFLHPKYEECIDAFLMPDMRKAVDRIKLAIQRQEKCLIYGDYDVDGVTASTALFDTLKMVGLMDAEIMLPNRFTDGYGMSNKVVQKAISDRVNLVFTVDCGSRNHEIIEKLNDHQIDTIVTDHHECGDTLPEAIAVVNPKRKDIDITGSLRELAGVGVVFKLAQALVKAGLLPAGQEKWLLDLVFIGTICDNMLLTGENRRLCHYGAVVTEKTRRPGLRELLRNAGVTKLTSDAIGYQIGPRLNAAGRLDTAEKALNVLMASQRVSAAQLASELEELNLKRKSLQKHALKEIAEQGIGDNPVIIAKGEWHEGVLGIIAGRLTEQYHRPAFVLAEIDGNLKGSGRSFGDFNLAEALDICRKYIITGGGHAAACGVKLEAENYEKFCNAINSYYQSLSLENQERYLEVHEDLCVQDFDDLSLEFFDEMKLLEPYGMGNQTPVFRLPNVRVVDASKMGNEGQHLRLQLWDQNGHGLKVMKFNAPEEYLRLSGGETVDAWITLEENIFRGIRSIEGRIVKLA